ncbi:hypothetical protein K438DRAFT_1207677 [Mycena galopus ATCC 62051]|nr:hypothetical protein K438DRAFT_1207677 [Mycena galopus ATCC 62051]
MVKGISNLLDVPTGGGKTLAFWWPLMYHWASDDDTEVTRKNLLVVSPLVALIDGAIYNLTGCTYNITHSTGYHRGLRCRWHQLDAGHVGRGMSLGSESPPTRCSTSPRPRRLLCRLERHRGQDPPARDERAELARGRARV